MCSACRGAGCVPIAGATLCYMETVTHREMRNSSSELLRRVEAGESVRITNRGHVAAMLVPASGTSLDELVERGEARAPRADLSSLAAIRRTDATSSAADIVDDARGKW